MVAFDGQDGRYPGNNNAGAKAMKMKLAHVFLAVALALPGLALTGCETPPTENFPELTYRHLAPINLAVGSFDVETRYIPPLKPPNVEHLAPVPPYKAVRQWGLDRIRTAGGENRARLVILDASIVGKDLPTKSGIEGAFTREQAKKYDGRIAVLLEILDPTGRQLAFVTARAERSETAPEGATIAEREKIWFAMTESMMRDLNGQLEDNIQKYFGPYLARG
jgi:hypothetical protein